jgi:hypothetical protein
VMSLLIRLWSHYYAMLCMVQNRSSGNFPRVFFSIMVVVLLLLAAALFGVAVWSFSTHDSSSVDLVDSSLDCSACLAIGCCLCTISIFLLRAVLANPIPQRFASSLIPSSSSGRYLQDQAKSASVWQAVCCCCCCCCLSSPVNGAPSHRRVELNAVWSAFVLGAYSAIRGLILIFFSILQSSNEQFKNDEATGWWALPAFYMLEIIAIVLCVLLLLETPSQTDVKTTFHPQLVQPPSGREIQTPRGAGPSLTLNAAGKPPLCGDLATTPRRSNSGPRQHQQQQQAGVITVVTAGSCGAGGGRDRVSSGGGSSEGTPRGILKRCAMVVPPATETPSGLDVSLNQEQKAAQCLVVSSSTNSLGGAAD